MLHAYKAPPCLLAGAIHDGDVFGVAQNDIRGMPVGDDLAVAFRNEVDVFLKRQDFPDISGGQDFRMIAVKSRPQHRCHDPEARQISGGDHELQIDKPDIRDGNKRSRDSYG